MNRYWQPEQNLLFEKVYIISLPSRKDRRIKLKTQLKQINLNNVEWFDGIDGQNIPQDLINKYDIKPLKEFIDPSSGRAITKGEMGCAISHYLLWEKALSEINDNQNILILEDDIIFHSNFDQECINLENSLKDQDWDMCYISRKKISTKQEEKVGPNLVRALYSYWTSGILYNKRGLEKLVSSNYLKNLVPADEFVAAVIGQGLPQAQKSISQAPLLKGFSVIDNLAWQDPDSFKQSDTEISPAYSTIKLEDFITLTVATDPKDGFLRLRQSLNKFGYPYKVLGMGEKWEGGDDILNNPGAGQKINILKREVEKLKDEDVIILFMDGYDTMATGSPKKLIDKFKAMNKRIVFGAEKSCWPDKNLASQYPPSTSPWKYLNSGQFIGYAKDIWNIIQEPIENSADDQLYYTLKFLENRDEIAIDNKCEMFQCMGQSADDLEIVYNHGNFNNKRTNTSPYIIHGNGGVQDKYAFNRITNYIGVNWKASYGYMNTAKAPMGTPSILISIIKNTTSTNNCLAAIQKLKSPDSKITIIINNELDYNLSLEIGQNFDYVFFVNSNIIFDDYYVLEEMIKADKKLITPMIGNNFKAETAGDHKLISSYEHKGIWNVPVAKDCYLMKNEILSTVKRFGINKEFPHNMVCEGIFMNLDNRQKWGFQEE